MECLEYPCGFNHSNILFSVQLLPDDERETLSGDAFESVAFIHEEPSGCQSIDGKCLIYNSLLWYSVWACIMHDMKSLIMIMVFVAVMVFAGNISLEDTHMFHGIISLVDNHVLTAAVFLIGLLITWYAVKFICFACKNCDHPASK